MAQFSRALSGLNSFITNDKPNLEHRPIRGTSLISKGTRDVSAKYAVVHTVFGIYRIFIKTPCTCAHLGHSLDATIT